MTAKTFFLVIHHILIYLSVGFMYAHVFNGAYAAWWMAPLGFLFGLTIAHSTLNAIKRHAARAP